MQLFAGFEGFALPFPTTDTEILEDMSNSREMLSPKFVQALKEFKALLKSKLTPKPSVNKGEKITGQGMHHTLLFLSFSLKTIEFMFM